jgi:ribosomal-protein-alanine N-acetyltransferase
VQIEDVFSDLPTIETNRLILRKVQVGDLNDMYEYTSDPIVTEHTSWDYHKSIEETKKWIEFTLDCYVKKKVTNWGMVHKDTQKFIGSCGFAWWNIEHSKAEIGYVMNPRFWGQGLMTEAINKVIDFGFTRMELNRIEATCKPVNIGSWRVMEKSGMQLDGVLRQYMKLRDEFIDVRLYSILKSDFFH